MIIKISEGKRSKWNSGMRKNKIWWGLKKGMELRRVGIDLGKFLMVVLLLLVVL